MFRRYVSCAFAAFTFRCIFPVCPMNRIGLTIALGIAAIVGAVFGFDPELDLDISRPFHDVTRSDLPFGLRVDPVALMVQHIGAWFVTSIVAAALAALLIKLVLPRARLLISTRASVPACCLSARARPSGECDPEKALGPLASGRCRRVERRRALHAVVGPARRLPA
jgi:hypothetical protein